MTVAFVDTETTGLDPLRHPIWEIAIITDDDEWVSQVRLRDYELKLADPIALEINHFHERYDAETALPVEVAAEIIERRLQGRHIVGAVPSFDEERIRLLCNLQLRAGRPPDGRYPWHYHLIDVEAMVVGWLARAEAREGVPVRPALPWDSSKLSLAVGVDPAVFEPKHSALADARWAKAMYEAMVGR